MFRNYLLVALRSIYRNKLHTIINIAGFSLGLAIVILLGRLVQREISSDKFHHNLNNIYFIKTLGWNSPYILAPTLSEEFPEIKGTLRLDYYTLRDLTLHTGNEPVTVDDIIVTDTSFFSFFTFKLISGNPETVLDEPNSLVLTEKMALSLFGEVNPVGKTVRVNSQHELTVTGIMEDIPANSSLYFNGLVSFSTLYQILDPEKFESWNSYVTTTLFTLREQASLNQLEEKMKGMAAEQRWDEFDVISFKDLHFMEEQVGYFRQGNISRLIILITIGLFILFIAAINYINLSMATFLSRSREMIIRKITGATRKQLITQILAEPIILSMIAMNIAVILANLFIPEFNRLLNSNFLVINTRSLLFWFLFLCGSVSLGIIVGLFPGIYLSGNQSIKLLSTKTVRNTSRAPVKKTLMLFQFLVSAILIICSIVMLKQFQFMRSKDLGFSHELIMVVPLSEELVEKKELFTSQLLDDPNIADYAYSNMVPGEVRFMVGTDLMYEGEEKEALFHLMETDDKFLEMLEFDIVSGRKFLPDMVSENKNILLNESAVSKFDFKNPMNASWPEESGDADGNVVGVVSNFHFRSLHKLISPLIIRLNPENADYLFLKLQSDNSQSVLKTSGQIREKWNQMSPNFPCEVFLLSDRLDQLYDEDRKIERVIIYFTLVAIFIACLGLFGLVSFMLVQQTKEIGIRKVNGAQVSDLIRLILKDYLKWIMLALIIACPVSYYSMNRWLQNFAYKTGISWWVFVMAGIFVLLMTLISTIYHVYRTARLNPADSLRYE